MIIINDIMFIVGSIANLRASDGLFVLSRNSTTRDLSSNSQKD